MSLHRPRPALLRRFALLVLLLELNAGLPGDRALATAGSHDPQHAYLVRQKNRVAVPAEYRPLTFEEFLALPAVSAQYEPSDWRTVVALSRWAVSLEGYIAEALPVPDGTTYGRPALSGDIHLHLRPVSQPRCFPAGAQGGQLVVEVTPHFQPPATGWSLAVLLELCQRQALVRISGWLLHDYAHVGAIGIWRASAWEIHPITKIEVWDDLRQVWQPLP